MVAEKQLEWKAFKCLGWPGALSTAAKSSNRMSFALQYFSTSWLKQLMYQSFKIATVIRAFGFEWEYTGRPVLLMVLNTWGWDFWIKSLQQFQPVIFDCITTKQKPKHIYRSFEWEYTGRPVLLMVLNTRWFKYDRDKLWLVYTQSVPVIFEPPCTWGWDFWIKSLQQFQPVISNCITTKQKPKHICHSFETCSSLELCVLSGIIF